VKEPLFGLGGRLTTLSPKTGRARVDRRHVLRLGPGICDPGRGAPSGGCSIVPWSLEGLQVLKRRRLFRGVLFCGAVRVGAAEEGELKGMRESGQDSRAAKYMR